MTATTQHYLADEAMDAYVDWRELCLAVQDAYDRWARAPRSQALAAFIEYTIALDREELASLDYAVLVGPLV